jgi:putative membrane protein
MTPIPLREIPTLNAALNGTSAALLVAGYSLIRRKKVSAHRFCMVTAFVCSIAFLGFYLYFHAHAGIIRLGGQGWIRRVYFALLISHTILAAAIPALAVITLGFAAAGRFGRHKKIARWTLPLWLYVSVTGVVIYWLLYVVYVPIGAPW